MVKKFLDWLFQRLEPISTLLEHLGWKESAKRYIKSAWAWALAMMSGALSAAYSAWLVAWSYVPHWAAPLVWFALTAVMMAALLGAAHGFMSLVIKYLEMKTKLEFDVRQYRQLGNDMLDLHRELMVFAIDELRDPDNSVAMFWADSGDPMRDHGKRMHRAAVFGSRFEMKFGPKVKSLLFLCKKLGIESKLRTSISTAQDVTGVARYLGAVGQLLADDKLDEARKLDSSAIFHVLHQ